MSTLSVWTMGAMASKKARLSSPVSSSTALDSAGEVRGPVDTITVSQSAGGRPATSPSTTRTFGWPRSAAVTRSEKATRSTARAPPAGTWAASPEAMISELQRRISACSRPTALCSQSSDRNELEQTSSAKPPVWCAGVGVVGRISCSTTWTPASASCQAASDPASPAPIT